MAVPSRLNPDGTTTLVALLSFWALGERIVLGVTVLGRSAANPRRHGECPEPSRTASMA